MSNSSFEKGATSKAIGSSSNASKVIVLDDLEPSHTLTQSDSEGFQRRFSTLFLDEGRSRAGGIGKVFHASNSYGEEFAIKVIDAGNESLGQNGDTLQAPDIDHYLQEAFEQEYETQRLSANIKGFPRLYGKGKWRGTPAMIMEWIEGETLSKAKVSLALDDQGRVSPLVAARLGIALFDLLARMELLNEGLVHRDISPSNIMVSTSGATIEEQLESAEVELRLIDFGSAALVARDSSITERFSAPRGATPDFAAPEMLTEDIPNVATLRKSPSIDVYAAGSVLYWLLTGHAPFDLRKRESDGERLSPYRVKVEGFPAPLEMLHGAGANLESALIGDPQTLAVVQEAMAQSENAPTKSEMLAALDRVDGQLSEIVFACLSTNQADRPTAKTVHDALESFLENYGENLERVLSGKALVPVSARSLNPAPPQEILKRPKAQIAGQVIAAAVDIAVICACAILLNGVPVLLNMFGSSAMMNASGIAIACILLLPAAFGALLRWNGVRSPSGFARATIGVLVGLILSLAFWLATTFPAPPLSYLYLGAAFAAAACSWLYFVIGFAFGNKRKGRQ